MAEYKGKIINGEFVPFASSFRKKRLEKYEGKEVVEIINAPKSKRSTEANAYYWKMLKFISDELGYTSEELHEMFKSKFLRKENLMFDETVVYYVTTTKLSVKDFYIYCEKIRIFMQDNGYYIPTKDEIDFV